MLIFLDLLPACLFVVPGFGYEYPARCRACGVPYSALEWKFIDQVDGSAVKDIPFDITGYREFHVEVGRTDISNYLSISIPKNTSYNTRLMNGYYYNESNYAIVGIKLTNTGITVTDFRINQGGIIYDSFTARVFAR